MTALRIGTRGSALARAQTQLVADRLAAALHTEVELVPVTTTGDRSVAPLAEIGGQGVFVAALRQAVLDGSVDVAVHSLKDLPTLADPRLALVAVPVRVDPRDALVSASGTRLLDLPAGATVGTGSPRRAAQLRALALGVDVVPIRGNVDSRVAKVDSGALTAVVVAHAGLIRLGSADRASEVLAPALMLPAPGQGALAVEVAAAQEQLAADVTGALDDAPTRAQVTAERALLAGLEAGCTAPVGALAEPAPGPAGTLLLHALVVAPDGSASLRMSATGDPHDAAGLGARLADDLLAAGAASLVREAAA